MDKKLIKRDLFAVLKTHLSVKEMSLLVGPRQAGKTTLLQLLEDDCRKEGKKTLFLSLDIENDRQFFVSQQALVEHIRLALGTGGIVFVDEAQRKENAGLFFKGIYDMGLPYKFILSGSGSLELKEKIHESMMGRKRLFELLPVSFDEFAAFRTDYRYGDSLREGLMHNQSETARLLDEYLRFGGYPAVVLAPDIAEKQHILNEIHQSYLIKDISFLLGVEKTDAFAALMRLLAVQVGNLVSVSELAATLAISVPTVKKYLWYLEQTYILRMVRPYFTNARSEITKMPVCYFYDLGLRNFSAQTSFQSSDGFLFENLVFLLLSGMRDPLARPPRFWRSKSGAEVDFVIEREGAPVPCEVKVSLPKRLGAGRSLASFIERYHPRRAYIVTKHDAMEMRVGETSIAVIPFYELQRRLV